MTEAAAIESARLVKQARHARLFAARDIRDIAAELTRAAEAIEAGEPVRDRLMDKARNLAGVAGELKAAEATLAMAALLDK
jgi:hypothetical protein